MSNTIRDVMTTPVVTVRTDTPFKQVVARVRAVGAVPVTDDSGLVLGIVYGRDLLAEKGRLERSPGRLAAAGRRGGLGKAGAATAASLMTSPAVTTRAEATTCQAARLVVGSHQSKCHTFNCHTDENVARGGQYVPRDLHLHLPAVRLHRGPPCGLVLRDPGHTAMERTRCPRRRGQRR